MAPKVNEIDPKRANLVEIVPKVNEIGPKRVNESYETVNEIARSWRWKRLVGLPHKSPFGT